VAVNIVSDTTVKRYCLLLVKERCKDVSTRAECVHVMRSNGYNGV